MAKKSMRPRLRVILANVAIILLLLFLIESFASIALYQRQRDYYQPVFASLRVITAMSKRLLQLHRPNGDYDALSKVLELRKAGVVAYPAYLFDPQLHVMPSLYNLAHPSEVTIVYCNEDDFWSIFRTDEIGFRNPSGQAGKNIDHIFLGDSFAEGACVQDGDTFAGLFRASGRSVLNLGRGGAGPLFELATLREYGPFVRAKSIIWFVFAGNDLANLREEKTTKLLSYLEEIDFSQGLLGKTAVLSESMKTFLDEQIDSAQERRKRSLPDPYYHAYGETLDEIEAERQEIIVLRRVAERILHASKNLGADLRIVIIEHPGYNSARCCDHTIQDITRKALIDFAVQSRIHHLVISRGELQQDKTIFSVAGPHFSPFGYKWAATKILRWLEKSDQEAERN